MSSVRTSREVLNESSPLERSAAISIVNNRYPYSLVWTPIPLLTWMFPFVGHMGICTSSGIIRDFAMSYTVLSDSMGFGSPTKYLQLDVNKVVGGQDAWDQAVEHASQKYQDRIHNLCLDNCHSHCSLALNLMKYDNQSNYNMVKLAFWMFFCSKYVGISGFFRTWTPFLVILLVFALFYYLQE